MNFKTVFARFNQPFPEEGGLRDQVIKAVWVGLFIAAFLYFFRPFGISNAGSDLLWVCAIFGLITTITTIVFTAVTRYVFNLKRDTDDWTLGRWLLDTLILVLFIAVVNYLFMLFLSATRFELEAFMGVVFNTFMIGLFPIVLSGLLIQISSQKKFVEQAAHLHRPLGKEEQAQHKLMSYPGDSSIGSFEFFTDDLLYIESRSNYLMIVQLEDGALKQEKVRGTLTAMEAIVGDYPIVRCHRSFLVNLEGVKKVSGNAQGLRLQMIGESNQEIPVSRTYVSIIRGHLSRDVS